MVDTGFYIIYCSIFCIMVAIVIFSFITKVRKNHKLKSEFVDKMPKEEYEKIKMYLNGIQYMKKLKNIHRILYCVSMISIFAIVFGYVLAFAYFEFELSFIFVGIIALVIIKVIDSKIITKYSKEYKNQVIQKLIKDIDQSLVYSPLLGMKMPTYNRMALERFDIYHSEDLIEGKIEGLNFTMSEVLTQKIETDSDGDTHYKTIFSGMAVCVELKKSITTDLYIGPSHLYFNKEKHVLMDNDKFNKKFNIYSDDKIMALRVITPDVSNEIMDFYEKTLIDIEIVIKGSNLFLRFHTGGLFEPSMKNETKEIQNIYLDKCILNTIQNIVKEFVRILNDLEV